MSVAEGRVEADIGDAAAPHVFLLVGDVGEDDARRGNTATILGVIQQVRLALKKAEVIKG